MAIALLTPVVSTVEGMVGPGKTPDPEPAPVPAGDGQVQQPTPWQPGEGDAVFLAFVSGLLAPVVSGLVASQMGWMAGIMMQIPPGTPQQAILNTIVATMAEDHSIDAAETSLIVADRLAREAGNAARAMPHAMTGSGHILRITQTETTRAVTAAAQSVYRDEDVAQWLWLTAEDERVCPRCMGNELAGPVDMGMPFPDGSTQPPAHPRCRCALTPANFDDVPAFAAADLGSLNAIAKGDSWLNEPRGPHGEWISFYHGTTEALKPGDLVSGGHHANEGGSRPGFSYFTHDPHVALHYARRNSTQGGHVYRVAPTGKYGDDPQSLALEGGYWSPAPLKVISEVTPQEIYNMPSVPVTVQHGPLYDAEGTDPELQDNRETVPPSWKLDKASENDHHIAGTPDTYRHGWIPLDGSVVDKALSDAKASGIKSDKSPGMGVQGDTHIITFNDGSTWIRKGINKNDADREELASKISDAIGAGAPHVTHPEESERQFYNEVKLSENPGLIQHDIWMPFVNGKVAARAFPPSDDPFHDDRFKKKAEIYKSPQGKKIGLLDLLTENVDRNEGNWIIGDDGQPIPIDHNSTWTSLGFENQYSDFSAGLSPDDFAPGELDQIEKNLRAIDTGNTLTPAQRDMLSVSINNLATFEESPHQAEPVPYEHYQYTNAQPRMAGRVVGVGAPDVAKVGLEGYEHGFVCVRPPCGKVPETLRATDLHVHADGTVLHTPSGYAVGSVKRSGAAWQATHADGTQTMHGSQGDALRHVAQRYNHRSATVPAVAAAPQPAHTALAVVPPAPHETGQHHGTVYVISRDSVHGDPAAVQAEVQHGLDIQARFIPGAANDQIIAIGDPGGGPKIEGITLLGNMIVLAPHVTAAEAGDAPRLEQERDQAEKWWVPSDPQYTLADTTVAHEMGHVAADKATPNLHMDLAAWTIVAKAAGITPPGTVKDVLSGRQRPGIPEWVDGNKAALKDAVSEYGASNLQELEAELWSEYTMTAHPRSAAKAYGDWMMAHLPASVTS
jgi:SPP1 gp7 family putative phage head morphogenesis protein